MREGGGPLGWREEESTGRPTEESGSLPASIDVMRLRLRQIFLADVYIPDSFVRAAGE